METINTIQKNMESEENRKAYDNNENNNVT